MSDEEDKRNLSEDEEETIDVGDSEKIKSTAVVKYSVPKPAQFVKLQCNTDLNNPPANWLSSSADSYGLQRVMPTQKGFASFRMAQMYPDCVGDVDVVSDAENIKKLLKLPYTKDQISMFVHRVGKSLLIDNFEIYRNLARSQDEQDDHNNWTWLHKFISEHVDHKNFQIDRHLYIQNRTREALKQKSLISKFLYHSLGIHQSDLMLEDNKRDEATAHCSKSLEYPLLPTPAPDAAAPDSDPDTLNQEYNRNVVWTFEDIEMLLGTDLPIFGGGTYPCLSLRLRDMTKPINILTGIDYWLDNLMSNVPEVVMCYHLDGIVQKYELIKTEDLPQLNNSKFSPTLIRDVAQNILSFLKTNATKAGHTYWLFKGKDEDIIKLYDLTCLVPQDEKLQNPFTIPVAMLLYRVARNFMKSNQPRPAATVRMLLKNCVKLLSEEKYPEIVTSSHFMLAEVYVPITINPENPNFEQEVENEALYEDEDEEEISDDDDPESAIKYLDLEQVTAQRSENRYKRPPPITGNVEERCLQSLHHVIKGLSCLKYFSDSSKANLQEDEVPMATSSDPIPMGYAKLSKENEGVKEKETKKGKKSRRKRGDHDKEEDKTNVFTSLKQIQEKRALPTWSTKDDMHKDGNSWKVHLKILLYEKAMLVYAALCEFQYLNAQYGSSLKSIGLLARCSIVLQQLHTTSKLRDNWLLGRAGDCCVMMVQHWVCVDSYKNQLHNYNEEDSAMMEQLERDEQFYGIKIERFNLKCVFLYDILTIEQILLKGIEFYDEALKVVETDRIYRRLANCLNETGTYYLNVSKTCKSKEDLVEVAWKSEKYLLRGLEIFERIKDEANIALLYANLGHMHRILGYGCLLPGGLNAKEKFHFNKSFMNYRKALQVLGDRETNPGIWDTVNWELSTALFNMATIMHENPPSTLPLAEAEKEVLETLQRALQHCDLDEDNPKFPLYQYRAALIHYRIASLYHRHILSVSEDISTKTKKISLARINYQKAAKLYFGSHDVINYFTAQMQKFGLLESVAESLSNPNVKLKNLTECLNTILELEDMIDLLVEKKVDMPELGKVNCHCDVENSEKKEYNTIYSLLKLVKQRLQHVLKMLLKICSSKKPPNKDCPKLAEIYKECYKISFVLKDDMNQHDLLTNLNDVLKQIKSLTKRN